MKGRYKMTALARKHFEDLGFNASLNEIISKTGDIARDHYFLQVIDLAYSENAPKEVLEFSEVYTFGHKPGLLKGHCVNTANVSRYVEYEILKGTIDLFDRDFFFSNIIQGLEEAKERFEEVDDWCLTICYENTDLTFEEMVLGLKTFIDDHLADFGFLVGHHKQTLSIHTL
jgi:hypothetical protein